jgi:hypothetical protein
MSKNGLPSLLERHWAESALAIGAVIIAAVSLWVAWDSVRTNRELVASSSWPFVQFTATVPAAAQPRYLALIVSNDGIGPAKLESFELFWQGHAQRSPWQLLQTCCARGQAGAGQMGSLESLHHDPGLETSTDSGIVLRAGEGHPILTYTRNAANAALWDVLSQSFTGNISVRYCFCSAFNECWQVSARMGAQRDLNPPRVPYCPRPGTPYDNTSD